MDIFSSWQEWQCVQFCTRKIKFKETMPWDFRLQAICHQYCWHWWQICKDSRTTVFYKFANSWAQSAIANLKISEICESANFFWLIRTLQIANPQILLLSQPTNCKSARELNIFFKTIKKSTAGLFSRIFYLIKFELEHFRYVFVRRKKKNFFCRFAGVLSPQKIWVSKSQIRK